MNVLNEKRSLALTVGEIFELIQAVHLDNESEKDLKSAIRKLNKVCATVEVVHNFDYDLPKPMFT